MVPAGRARHGRARRRAARWAPGRPRRRCPPAWRRCRRGPWSPGRRRSSCPRPPAPGRCASHRSRRRPRRVPPVRAGRHTDQFGEARAGGAQRRSSAIACSMRRVIRWAYGDSPQARRISRPRCPADMCTPRARSRRPAVRVLPVDPVADAAQPREVAQVLFRVGSAGHPRDRATWCRRSRPQRARPRGPGDDAAPPSTGDGAAGGVRAACRNRTDDLLITSEMLYRLS